MGGLVVLAILILVAIFAPYIAPHDPFQQNRGQFFSPPGGDFLLGTDDLGRDVLSRLIFGSRISLMVGFVVALSSVLVGMIMGLLAGYFAGRPFRFYLGPLNRQREGWRPAHFAVWRVISWLLFYAFLGFVANLAWVLAGTAVTSGFQEAWSTNAILSLIGLLTTWGVAAAAAVWGIFGSFRLDIDTAISRLIDFMLTMPQLPLLLVLSGLLRDPQLGLGRWAQATFGNAYTVAIIIFILALFGWITTARLVRGTILSLREQDYTSAAQALGVSEGRIMFRHLLPNSVAPIIVDGTLQVGIAILVEAALSFLGFGIQPPVATWGNMLTGAQEYMITWAAWWLAFPPGVMIIITVLAINYIGDGLRDALDPRSQEATS